MPRIDMTTLDEETLAEWLLGQRWFGSKARDVAHVRVLDLLTLARRPAAAGRPRSSRRASPPARTSSTSCCSSLREGVAGEDVDRLRRAAPPSIDALADPQRLRGARRPAARARRGRRRARDGHLPLARRRRAAARRRRRARAWAPSSRTPRSSSTTRSCSRPSAASRPGDNPELEMLRFLTERGFDEHRAARAAGTQYEGELMDATLGVVQALRRRRARRLGAGARRARATTRALRRAPARARRGHRPDAHRARPRT